MITRLRLVQLRSQLAGPFNLEIAAGDCVSVTGASGAGKSLLLRMIADLDPNEGDIWLDGRARASFTSPAWRRQVAYAAAEPGWWDDQVAPHFPDTAAARILAGTLGLAGPMLDGPVARLSTGERQRLALVRTLLPEPAVLLLDEPTGALDATSVGRVESVLRERLARGAALLLVTHDADLARRLATRHLIMAAGRLTQA